MTQMTTAAMLVAEERRRQITDEQWTADHDDQHRPGMLVAAGEAYAHVARHLIDGRPYETTTDVPPAWWPFDWSWWKPSPDPVRNMVKAAALACAEIDKALRHRGVAGERVAIFEGEEPALMAPVSLLRDVLSCLHSVYDGTTGDEAATMDMLASLLARGPHFTDDYGSVWAGAPGAPDSVVLGDVLDLDHQPGPLTVDRPWRWLTADVPTPDVETAEQVAERRFGERR